jgi:hypothetical protein
MNVEIMQWDLRLLPVLGQNSTGQSTSTTFPNPSLAHKHNLAGSPVI